jgi:N6-L-threonylcarbamoyladenine synthase
MLTLGIETSCDETACAVLRGRHEIKSNIVSSSLFRHRPFGGVVPEIASRHCLEQIDFVFHKALEHAKVKARDLDLIAVTEGPGLIGSLLVGVCFAKSLSYELKIPFVGVNHLEAHLVANFISPNGEKKKEPARYIGLLVSGGHTCLTYHAKGRATLLGETVDDAVGEAYDKVAKILGLGYPGGPILDRLSREGNPEAFHFTTPKQANPFDFSFSGIKTAVLYFLQQKKRGKVSLPKTISSRVQRDMAASFQKAVVNWLVEKTLKAAENKRVKDIVVGGGVSANSSLRQRLTEEGQVRGFRIWIPPLSLTGDNAAMIARRGVELYESGKRSSFALTGNAALKLA